MRLTIESTPANAETRLPAIDPAGRALDEEWTSTTTAWRLQRAALALNERFVRV
jgi:hypothetical protein